MLTVRELQATYAPRQIDVAAPPNPKATTPKELAAIIAKLPTPSGAPIEDSLVEVFGVVLLSTKHRLNAYALLSVGTLDATIVHPRDVFRAAVLANAASVALFHCHPSGDPEPSPDDIKLTERMVAAGIVMGIAVIDHIIVADGGRFYSFKEAGRLS